MGSSFHLGIWKIYKPYKGNLEPFRLWFETLDKMDISIYGLSPGLQLQEITAGSSVENLSIE